MVTREEVIQAIKQVYDPEIPVNVYDLGLIYEVNLEGDSVHIRMTLTSMGCPSAQQIPELIRARVATVPHVKDVQVEVVWQPTWNPSMISPEGKKILRLENES
ncbi:MAG: DUF59 domain-containing protein [Candidatus Omnitrophica bacterium]|nr:DUF59 domain-containing protein [Candidatus Omnitrophota bacterium]